MKLIDNRNVRGLVSVKIPVLQISKKKELEKMIDTSLATQFLGEVIGTAILIILGAGVVAGVSLKRSKAENGGWVVIL